MRYKILAALACGFLAATAAPTAAGPKATIHVGFDGLVRLGRPLHLRVELENEGPAWSGILRLEETLGERTSLAWEWSVEVPAEGRRAIFLSLSPAVVGEGSRTGLRAGLVGEGEPRPLDYRLVQGDGTLFVALNLTDSGTGFSAVRDALDPPGPNQGAIEVQLPAMRPEEAPPDPAAWEAIDAIVIDLAVADRLDAPTWLAISTRVAQGASLVLHGPSRLPPLFPEEMVPGRPEEGGGLGRWQEPLAELEHSAMSFEPVPGARRLEAMGGPLSWASSLRFGAGRVTVAGVDLRNLRSPSARLAPLWAELLGMPAEGRTELIRPPASAAESLETHPLSEASFGDRSIEWLLGLSALCCATAVCVVRWKRRSQTLIRLAPLVGLLSALPVFGVATVSRVLEDGEPFVVEEHLEVLGLTRSSTTLTPQASRERIRRLPLAGWPPRVRPRGLGGARPLGLVLRGGAAPVAEGLRPAHFPGLSFRSETWEKRPAPFRLERGSGGEELMRNVSGRDLSGVHCLRKGLVTSLGDLADGASVPLGSGILGERDSPSHAALVEAGGRLSGPAFAGVVEGGGASLLSRPVRGVVVAWLETPP